MGMSLSGWNRLTSRPAECLSLTIDWRNDLCLVGVQVVPDIFAATRHVCSVSDKRRGGDRLAQSARHSARQVYGAVRPRQSDQPCRSADNLAGPRATAAHAEHQISY